MQTILSKYWTFFIIVILLVGGVWIWVSSQVLQEADNTSVTAPQVGFQAPPLTLTSLKEEEVSLADQQGSLVLLNFWATWCPPCRAEMPAMEAMHQKYAGEGLVIIAVNATRQDNINDVIHFAGEYQLTFPILLDKDSEASEAYQIRSLPTTFFIDHQGRILDVIIGGPIAEALLESRIEAYLKETP
jgi:thiol-disulfide isomerase/thioredoxin